MKIHLITVIVLLLALSCYVAGMTGPGLVLFFAAAAFEILLWLLAVQRARRASPRTPARLGPRS